MFSLELCRLHQAWREAEHRASDAELALLEMMRRGDSPAPCNVREVHALRADASARLAALLAFAGAASRACRA